jgi:hypothetical protein
MIKQNVVEARRTPSKERDRADGDWDKTAAAEFKAPEKEIKPIKR